MPLTLHGTHSYKAIGQVVRAAREAMDWLQSVAKLAAKDGLPIQLVTPAGLPSFKPIG
jgi:DNA-directed RNA polymerase